MADRAIQVDLVYLIDPIDLVDLLDPINLVAIFNLGVPVDLADPANLKN